MDAENNYKCPYSMVNLMVTEKDFMKYAESIRKALNGMECPVKPKHLRFTVVGTFREQGAKTFWSVALRTPYLDDRIVAWKLCYVVHKILKEGHPLCIVHSQVHKKELDEMGKLWRHLRGTYSQGIALYTNLLIAKIDFHNKNPRIPGNLAVTDEEFNSILSDDINNYFQLAVEIFDYLDLILELQSAIFGPISITENNSDIIGAADQCLLAPIVLCLQDASKLYDLSVKIMFKLHLSISGDVISGHRERFLKAFNDLKEFYKKTNTTPYLMNLVSVQSLPDEPPDFFTESEFYYYEPHEVTLPENDATGNFTKHKSTESLDFNNIYGHNSTDGLLVDIPGNEFRGNSYHEEGTFSPTAPVYEQVIFESSTEKGTVSELENEVPYLKQKLESVVQENQRKILILENQISKLETDLENKDRQLDIEKRMRQSLQNSTIPENPFNKPGNLVYGDPNSITNLYGKLRNDYINLLQKNGELQTQVQNLQTKLAEKENETFA